MGIADVSAIQIIHACRFEKNEYRKDVESLNYHHLLYFWTVAREGSIQAAAAKLRWAHPTVSGQIKQLESSLGHRLLQRKGRSLELT